MAKTDPHQEGLDAAKAGGRRQSPYDGRTEAGRSWYAGYDAYEAPATSGMTLSDTPYDASAPTDQSADDNADDEEKPTEESEEPTDESEEPDDAELAPAGESTDPDVQRAIANLHAHRMVVADDGAGADAKRQARAAIDRGVRELRKMGYRA